MSVLSCGSRVSSSKSHHRGLGFNVEGRIVPPDAVILAGLRRGLASVAIRLVPVGVPSLERPGVRYSPQRQTHNGGNIMPNLGAKRSLSGVR